MATVKRKSKTAKKKVAANAEAIRVVPLHHPKMNLKLEDIGFKKADIAFLKNEKAVKAATPKLVYNGGPVIKNVKVYTVFWGRNWASDTAFVSLKKNINDFFTSILTSSMMDQMAEYNVAGSPIGHGSLIGTKTITVGSPKTNITDSKIRTALSSWISAGTIPAWDANTLYFIYFDKGIKVTMGGSSSCTSFCGYHDAINSKTYYSVMPFPSCAGCLGGQSVLDAITGTTSHELCEAITDPVPGTGWYDNANGEIGDICGWKFKKINGYTVQLEWSNKTRSCV